ncbi:MAG: subclass B3 metallo-beta-lactamase [Acidobacteria bacterium]|nr:subclass B3 metallo-beta-lactamase [Acidobacteriota bacterium]
MKCAIVLALAVAFGAVQIAPSDPSWRQPFDPIRIVGNIYYVGTRGLSSFLLVTPAGGVLIDSGEAESVPFIRANVERLGFRMSEIKILLAGHAHFDHVGGHAEMKRLTGAGVMVMDADRQALESGVDRSALGAQGWSPVKVDRVLKDGDTVSLGGTTLTAHLTPGHTQGCTTWTTEATQDGRRYRVAFACSVTINQGVHLVSNTRVPAIAEHYAQAFRVLHGLTPDVFVAEHGGVFGLDAKAETARDLEKGQPNPFVDPQGYRRFVEKAEQTYLTQLRAEQGK